MIYNIKMEFHDTWRVELDYDWFDTMNISFFINNSFDEDSEKWEENSGIALSVQETRNFANYLLKYCDFIEEFKKQNPE